MVFLKFNVLTLMTGKAPLLGLGKEGHGCGFQSEYKSCGSRAR